MMLDMNQNFNVHTIHTKTPQQVMNTDPVEFDAAGLMWRHDNTVRLIPWAEITAIVQVIEPTPQELYRPGDPR
jgi:hypothetical protein